jgi:hypothetical protein
MQAVEVRRHDEGAGKRHVHTHKDAENQGARLIAARAKNAVDNRRRPKVGILHHLCALQLNNMPRL